MPRNKLAKKLPNDQKYKCSCGKNFVYQTGLMRHIECKHNSEPEYIRYAKEQIPVTTVSDNEPVNQVIIDESDTEDDNSIEPQIYHGRGNKEVVGVDDDGPVTIVELFNRFSETIDNYSENMKMIALMMMKLMEENRKIMEDSRKTQELMENQREQMAIIINIMQSHVKKYIANDKGKKILDDKNK